ncbi:MAG: acyl-CoA thioesterase [Candidatus Nanopelagicales bacterium]
MSPGGGRPRGDEDPRSLRVTDFAVVRDVPTRWADEDTYGHVNNAVHYLLFDTAVNGWLIEQVGDVREHPSFGVVAETGCRYLGELRFPERIRCGIGLGRLGTTSITYRLALFGDRGEEPAATGLFVHVYVDRVTRRPVPVPDEVRRAVAVLLPWP